VAMPLTTYSFDGIFALLLSLLSLLPVVQLGVDTLLSESSVGLSHFSGSL